MYVRFFMVWVERVWLLGWPGSFFVPAAGQRRAKMVEHRGTQRPIGEVREGHGDSVHHHVR